MKREHKIQVIDAESADSLRERLISEILAEHGEDHYLSKDDLHAIEQTLDTCLYVDLLWSHFIFFESWSRIQAKTLIEFLRSDGSEHHFVKYSYNPMLYTGKL